MHQGPWRAKRLDPGTHMGEILFGLIIRLTMR
jgi:hypothetical protein